MSGIIHKVALLGREFTVQTEFIPGPARKIRTLVYDGGRLITSREIAVGPMIVTDDAVDAKVKEQHKRITDTLIQRAADLQATKTTIAPPKAERPPPPAPAPPSSKGMVRPEIDPDSPLAAAIAIRKTIGPFGLAFARPAPVTANEYETLLGAVERSVDRIMKSSTWDQIRLDEQLTMIAIRGQLATWRLADRDLAMATEIWPSVERFAYHQQKISNRGDLVAFDHKLLTWAMSELGKGGVSAELVDGLYDLTGRDAELDGLLEEPDRMSSHALLEILMRLIDETFV
jgi:hypothetical protein